MENQKMQLIERQSSFKITVQRELEEKIREMCKALPVNEWSGTLFYTVEGTMEDNNLHIFAKDFYLQDVGVATFTEFKNDATLAGYMVDHDLLDCYTGLIHSHNKMAAFFSGTDTGTLLSEGKDTNHFVSLIVNNAGKYVAAITRKVSRKIVGTAAQVYNTFNNIPVIQDGKQFETETTQIEYFPLEMNVETVPEQKSELAERIEFLTKAKANRIPAMSTPSFMSWNERQEPILPTAREEHGTKPTPKSEPEQLTLFDDDFEELVPGASLITDALVEKHFKQLITLNLFANLSPTLDINKWCVGSEQAYNKLFEKDIDGSLFEYVADVMIDVLTEDLERELETRCDDNLTSLWAMALTDKLNKCDTTNHYIQTFIASLERWIQ